MPGNNATSSHTGFEEPIPSHRVRQQLYRDARFITHKVPFSSGSFWINQYESPVNFIRATTHSLLDSDSDIRITGEIHSRYTAIVTKTLMSEIARVRRTHWPFERRRTVGFCGIQWIFFRFWPVPSAGSTGPSTSVRLQLSRSRRFWNSLIVNAQNPVIGERLFPSVSVHDDRYSSTAFTGNPIHVNVRNTTVWSTNLCTHIFLEYPIYPIQLFPLAVPLHTRPSDG